MGGTTDYVVPMPPEDCCSAGTFVSEFDVGQVAVGNGEPDCHWVRDNLSVRVGTIGPDPTGKILVLVSAEVYMLFRFGSPSYSTFLPLPTQPSPSSPSSPSSPPSPPSPPSPSSPSSHLFNQQKE